MSVATTAQEIILRMQEDLQRALRKPVEERSWVMVMDVRKCIGCRACEAACIVENVLPPGVTYRTVPEVEWRPAGTVDGNYRPVFMPTNCFQCAKPPCVKVANVVTSKSFTQRPDGIVAINYNRARFRGRMVFKAARDACPYRRAVYFDDGRYYTSDTPGGPQFWETRVTYEYNQQWTRSQIVGSPRKCHFCVHRLEAGILPACVTTCVGRLIYIGDINDAGSFVSEVLQNESANVLRIKDWAGTEPRVYYLSDTPEECKAHH